MGDRWQTWARQQQARYRYRRGLDAVNKGDLQRAIAEFTAALSHHPRPAIVYLSLGNLHWQRENLPAALESFNQAIAVDPSNAKAYGNRGLLHSYLGDTDQALTDWDRALSHRPKTALVHYNRGLFYLHQQRYEEALADFNQALETNPNLADAYLHRGNVRQWLGDLPGAIADWELALCNDLRLNEARIHLQQLQQIHYDTRLAARIKAVLEPDSLSVTVQQKGDRLDITIHRPQGVGINYMTLPNTIRDHLVKWQISGFKRFKLTGQVADQSFVEWQQVYDLYKGQPCPPSHWKTASLTTLLLCPPFGLAALIFGWRVRDAYNRGDYPTAVHASRTAKALCISGSAMTAVIASLTLSYLGVMELKAQNPNPPRLNHAMRLEAARDLVHPSVD